MTHNELPCEDYCIDPPEGLKPFDQGVSSGPVEPFPRFGRGRFFEGAQPVRVALKPRKITVDGNNRFYEE